MTQNKTKKLDANQPEAFIAYQLRVAEQLITKTFERQLRQAGVESSFASLAVLQVLADGRRLSGAELARASLVTPQTMNGVLRVMESQGLVLEGADPDSARRRLWSITKKGCATLSAAQAVLWPFLERMDAALGADKKVVMTALGALIAELQRPDAESDES
jgi:DNA-binding MarR family transcriptional regulator